MIFKRFVPALFLAFSVLLLSNRLFAQETPVIDRELFFGNPEIASGQLSPDGQWISFTKEYEGIMNIWVKKFDEPFEQAKPLTDSKRPLYGYFWTEDSRYILYVKDKDGDENINVFAVEPALVTASTTIPESRNLTPLDEVTAQIYHVSDKDADLLMIGLNDRDKAWHDLYSLSISTGELTLLYENTERITGYDFDWDDQLRLLSKTDEQGTTTLFRIDGDNELVPIYETLVTESAYPVAWNEDNSKFYLISNKGELNLSTLFLVDPATKSQTKVASDPEGRVDFGGMRIDQNTRKIISFSYTDEKTRIYWQNPTWEANYNYLKAQFPGREVSFQSNTKDYGKFLISVYGDRFASEAYFFDANSRELIHQYTPRPALKEVEEHLSPMEPLRYKSSDGLEIPAYLTIPKGLESKELPLVVLVHGGPKGPRDYWGYDAEVQFLANRGYAVLQTNFRSSGGYGKAFLNAGDLQWGKLMQDDITWGVKHLINQGIVDKNRVAIMGGSYGGYATLAGLAFTPGLYTCGVDIVGPSNLFTLLESVPPYWESARAYLYGMVGDPNTEEGQQLIREASPLFSVEKIDKPLLIIQGANDPRVKQAEADQIVIALRDKQKPVTYLLAEDEGHGFAKPINRMAMYAETEKFLFQHLKGRYQQDMPEEVAKRLEELRVDISQVTYEPTQAVKVPDAMPKLSPKWAEGSATFEVVVEAQGQKIPLTINRTIAAKAVEAQQPTKKKGKQQRAAAPSGWVVTEATTGAMQGSDKVVYTSSAVPELRSISQMGQQVEMNFGADKVAISAMGQNMEVPMPGVYMTDGPGMDLLIGGLPLAPDFQLSFYIPDIMSMKAKQMVLKVMGQEEMNGKLCHVVEVSALENPKELTTFWISDEGRQAEKKVQIIPAMGNAKMTMIRK